MKNSGRSCLLAGLLAGLSVAAPAWAAGPSVSVPSTPDTQGKVLIQGRDFSAYSNVTVRFSTDKLTPIDMVTQTGGNGSFAVNFQPPIVGGYEVIVFDSGGRRVGGGRFGHFR